MDDLPLVLRRILVAHGLPVVSMDLAEMIGLTLPGAEVSVAWQPREALGRLRRDDVSAIFTDSQFLLGGGPELVGELRVRLPYIVLLGSDSRLPPDLVPGRRIELPFTETSVTAMLVDMYGL